MSFRPARCRADHVLSRNRLAVIDLRAEVRIDGERFVRIAWSAIASVRLFSFAEQAGLTGYINLAHSINLTRFLGPFTMERIGTAATIASCKSDRRDMMGEKSV